MAIPVLDNEFMQYWAKLTLVEKESLLNVAKHYVHLKKAETDTDDLRKQLVMEEREKYLKGEGKSFSWDEVKDMSVNKEKRDGLSN
jgi:L-lysine 2,3-aminomutase